MRRVGEDEEVLVASRGGGGGAAARRVLGERAVEVARGRGADDDVLAAVGDEDPEAAEAFEAAAAEAPPTGRADLVAQDARILALRRVVAFGDVELAPAPLPVARRPAEVLALRVRDRRGQKVPGEVERDVDARAVRTPCRKMARN